MEATRNLFEKKELDPNRKASDEASLDIFRWFIVGEEGLPLKKIYRDHLLHEMCEDLKDDDSGDEPGEPEHRDSYTLAYMMFSHTSSDFSTPTRPSKSLPLDE